jgi:hypothetical protein
MGSDRTFHVSNVKIVNIDTWTQLEDSTEHNIEGIWSAEIRSRDTENRQHLSALMPNVVSHNVVRR